MFNSEKRPTSSKDSDGLVQDGSKDEETEAKSNVAKQGDQLKDPSIPDRSYGDYYCGLCDSHMNCHEMWMAHVGGKRHLKNVKKGLYRVDSKYVELDVESDIKSKMANVRDPVVGLSYIHEIRKKEPNVPPFYTCFLCQATLATIPLVVEHVVSMKHRLNYIKQTAPSEFELLSATSLKSHLYESLVEEAALKLENKFGKGKVLVKQERRKTAYPKRRTYFSSDDDDDFYHRRFSRQHSSSRSQSREDRRVSPSSYTKGYKSNARKCSKHSSSRSQSREDRRVKVRSRECSKSHSREDRRYSMYDEGYQKHSKCDDVIFLGQKYSYRRKRSTSPKYESKRPYEEQSKKRCTTSPKKNQSEEYYSQPRSNLLPHEVDATEKKSSFTEDLNSFKTLLQQIFDLPTPILLKIFATKLENMDITSTEELSLISKMIVKLQKLLQINLPPELQELMKQSYSTTSNSTAKVPVSSPECLEGKSQATSDPKQSDLSYLKDILNTVRDVSLSSSAVTQPTAIPNDQMKNSHSTPSHNSYSDVPPQDVPLGRYTHYNAQTNIYVNPGFALVRNRNPNSQPTNNFCASTPHTIPRAPLMPYNPNYPCRL